MFIIVGAVIGAIWGFYLAKKRNGTGLDIAQHVAGTAIAFALIGLILAVIVQRSFGG